MAPSTPFPWQIEQITFDGDLSSRAFLHSVEAVNFHSHAAFEVLMVVRGRVVLHTEGHTRQMEIGDVAIIHSWQPHATQELDDGNIVLALQISTAAFRTNPDFLTRKFNLDEDVKGAQGQRERRVIGALLARAFLETLSKRSGWKMEVEAAILQLAAFLMREVVHFETDRSEFQPMAQSESDLGLVLQRVADYVRANATTELSIEDVARAHRISSGYLSRLFKQETGSSFTAFLSKVRLWRSLQLLSVRPDVKVITIAHSCGFPNVKSYNLAFRRAFNCSPGDWRRKKATPAIAGHPYKDMDTHFAVKFLETYLQE